MANLFVFLPLQETTDNAAMTAAVKTNFFFILYCFLIVTYLRNLFS
jgi:hypothetical protein